MSVQLKLTRFRPPPIPDLNNNNNNNNGDEARFDLLAALPREIAIHIGLKLSPEDLYNASHVCQKWSKLFDQDAHGFGRHSDEIDSLLPKHCKRLDESVMVEMPKWKASYLRYRRVESNWRKGRQKYMEVDVDEMGVQWFRMRGNLAAICTPDNSLHIASMNENKILADLDDFHEFSPEIDSFCRFDHSAKRLVFAVQNFVKVCGVEDDWCQCVTIEILNADDFVDCEPAVSDKFVAFGSRRLTIYSLSEQALQHQTASRAQPIVGVHWLDAQTLLYLQGRHFRLLHTARPKAERQCETGHCIRSHVLDRQRRRLVTADEWIEVHDWRTGRLVRRIQLDEGSVVDLDLNDEFLLAVSASAHLLVFDLSTGEQQRIGHLPFVEGIKSAKFVNRNLIVATRAADRSVLLLERRSGRTLQTFPKLMDGTGNVVQVVQGSRLAYIDDKEYAFVMDFGASRGKSGARFTQRG